jgi:rubrerythrin
MEINKKYIIKNTKDIKANKMVFICPECHCDLNLKGNTDLYNEIIGFSSDGIYAIVECPDCFYKWKFHSGFQVYEMFLEAKE